MAELAVGPGQAGIPGREQAEQNYDEAVAVAVAACAADTAGQRCYICFGEGDEEGLVRMCACRWAAGFVHLSCLARQAEVAVERGAGHGRGWERWSTCRLCEQDYHGLVKCALGWACWKTYVDRPEADLARGYAMIELGNGLYAATHYEDALSVQEAHLSTMNRLGDSESNILVAQANLAITYETTGPLESALQMKRDVYSGRLNTIGEEHGETLRAANNYAVGLALLKRYGEAKSVLRKMMPVVRRVLGEGDRLTLQMRWIYARALYEDDRATLDDFCEAVTTLEESARIARRVLGGAHPVTTGIEETLRRARAARAALRGREDRDDESLDVSAQEDPPPPPPPRRRLVRNLCDGLC